MPPTGPVSIFLFQHFQICCVEKKKIKANHIKGFQSSAPGDVLPRHEFMMAALMCFHDSGGSFKHRNISSRMFIFKNTKQTKRSSFQVDIEGLTSVWLAGIMKDSSKILTSYKGLRLCTPSYRCVDLKEQTNKQRWRRAAVVPARLSITVNFWKKATAKCKTHKQSSASCVWFPGFSSGRGPTGQSQVRRGGVC